MVFKLQLFWLFAIPFAAISQQDSLTCTQPISTSFEKFPILLNSHKLVQEFRKLNLIDSISFRLLVDCKGEVQKTFFNQYNNKIDFQNVVDIAKRTEWIAAVNGGQPVAFWTSFSIYLNSSGIFYLNLAYAQLPPVGNAYSLEELYESISWTFPIKNLVMSSRNLDSIFIDSNKMHFVEIIDLENNRFDHIPNKLSKLRRLKELYLGNNLLSDISDDFSKLKSLEIVGLAQNQLRKFPLVFLRMKNLRVLDISSNGIKELPEELDNLSRLEILVLRDNKLNNISNSILKLKKLKVLDLAGNPIPSVRLQEIKLSLKNTEVIIE